MRRILLTLFLLGFVSTAVGQPPTPPTAEQLKEAEEALRRMDAMAKQSRIERATAISLGRVLASPATSSLLRLSSAQSSAFRELLEQLRADARESQSELDLIDDPERKLMMIEARHASAETRLESLAQDILTAEQLEHLTTLTLNKRFQSGGIEALLNSSDLSPAMQSISAKNIKAVADARVRVENKFKQRLQELSKKYSQERRQIEEEMLNEILDPLPEKDRKAIETLMKELEEANRQSEENPFRTGNS